jgi:hypothetical protein
MPKIERLSDTQIIDIYGTVYSAKAPDNQEIMKKINEIIDVVNALTEKLQGKEGEL